MTNSDLPSTPAAQSQASRMAQLLVVFTAAIFLSAALLFAVQPMFTKLVLPRLGGAPAVWSVAMVFFQAALLAGYGYAHALTSFPGRRSVMVHLALAGDRLFLVAAVHRDDLGPPPVAGEAFWLLGLFAVSIGPPFFALAANAPLLQAWFARTDHPSANDPYFLYAASNVGSFLALLSYPMLIEPFISLGPQTWLWAAGFIVLILGRRVRLSAVAFAATRPDVSARRRDDEDSRVGASDLERYGALGVPGSGAVRAAGRGDRAYLDRRRRGAAALGDPARALSRYLRDRVLAPADHSALARGRDPAGFHPRRWSRSSSTSRSGSLSA